MTSMGTHSAGKGGSLRRAWICAWIVTFAMGGTTMAFQVYHSLRTGQMPWSLAWLFGIMPLLIAMLVLEIVAEWRGAPWPAKAVAYLVMAGAMYMSASGTGDVVQHAAPKHWSLLFGALLDAAELLAAYFIMNGPRAADTAADAAAAAVAARESELRVAANAERFAREEAGRAHEAAIAAARHAHNAALAELGRRLEAERAEWRAGAQSADAGREEEVAALRREMADGQAAMSERLDAVSASREAALSAQRARLMSEVEAERTARVSAQQDLASARQEAAGALARSEKLAAKLAALSGPKPGKSPKASDAADGLEQETNLLRAQMEILDDRSLAKPRMGGELARRLGLGASTGRRLHGALTENGRLRPEFERSPGAAVSDPAER